MPCCSATPRGNKGPSSGLARRVRAAGCAARRECAGAATGAPGRAADRSGPTGTTRPSPSLGDELGLHELAVERRLLDEIVMPALGDDSPAVEDDDAIDAGDRRQAMCDDQRRRP